MSSSKTQSNELGEMQMKPSNVQAHCKKVVKYLFSYVGLVIMVILYAIAGSFLFELLEKHEEVRLCEQGAAYDKGNMTKYRLDILNYIQFNVSVEGGDNETVANAIIDNMLTDYRGSVMSITSNTKFSGQSVCDADAKWDFTGGLLFAVAVFTTIGYGNITPITWEGQIVCICYAIIGIPLFLMCLANISGVLGSMFRFLYSRVCCRLCRKKDTKKDKVVSTNQRKHAWNTDASGKPGSPRSDAAIIEHDSDEESEQDEEEEEEETVNVPLTVTMTIIGGYIIAGAFLFAYFEGWEPIESGYFCFITLSTIGFGDYVPGQNREDKQKSIKLVIGAVYVVIGMATVGMCFELMQAEIITKFTWIGRMMGLLEKPEATANDDDDDDDDSDNDEHTKTPAKNDYPITVQGSQTTLKQRSVSTASNEPTYQERSSRPSSVKNPPPANNNRQQSPQGAAVYRPMKP